MIPTIETICEDLKAGTITVQQAIEWLHIHAHDAGVELRDNFAMAALQGLIAMGPDGYNGQYDIAVKVAYEHADAMLKARARV